MASAMKTYLYKSGDSLEVMRSNRGGPKGTVCRISGTVFKPGHIDADIVTLDAEGNETARRDWSLDTTVDPEAGEQIVCSKDTQAIQDFKDAKAAEQAAEDAKQAKIEKLRQDFRANCRDAFSQIRGKPQEFNTCLSALFKKEFGGFEDLPEDALEFK